MSKTLDLTAKPLDLEKMVEYQPGSVVSRTLLQVQNGTATLFAFDEGQELSEHTAPFDALAHILDGEAEISVSGNFNHLEAGQMIIMPADQPHALQAVRRFKMLLVMIKNSH